MLVGPLLRRVEPRSVSIWVATSEDVRVTAEILSLDGATGAPGPPVGGGEAQSVRLGPRLFVHLVEAVPLENRFPVDELLGYDVVLERDGEPAQRLADLGLLEGRDRIVYGNLSLPSFFIREQEPTLNVVHGSCRLLHGAGEDALLSVDEALSRSARDLSRRPSALFLTGDQIYADDVAGALIVHLRKLAGALMGAGDATSVPGTSSLDLVPIGGRKDLALDAAGFTSDKATNHLMSFGEFAAMYLVAWNRENWPPRFEDVESALPRGSGPSPAVFLERRKYRREVRDLERARAALGAVRRVLANAACYMTFDDHDVTDDWNLTARWREKVKASPTGRRIVANALAAYWAFQGWGNDPKAYPASWLKVLSRFLADESGEGEDYEAVLWSFDAWSFVAPTIPPTLVLDTRTQRAFDSAEGAARLVGPEARLRLQQLVSSCERDPDAPLGVVSAVPVCGLELQERRQKFLVKQVGPYEIDFEAWQSNLQGFVDLMCFLVEDLKLESCLFLSGDVHYGLNLRFIFAIGDRSIAITQLVSSGLKHSGVASKSALRALGSLVRTRHERVGWERSPPVEGNGSWRKHVMLRAVNTDDWADDAPVFLAPAAARRLRISRKADYRELRLYVKPSGRGTSILIGENNAGLVRVTGREVEHLLLSRGRKGTRVRGAAIRFGISDEEASFLSS